MSIHFFHAADLHLDSPFKGIHHMPVDWQEKLKQASFEALERLVQDAENHRPDFVVISGDLYDGENRSLRAQRIFQLAMERLAVCHIPVFIIHGNHDHLNGRWARFELPSNVFVFPEYPTSHIVPVNNEKVQLAGFSYPSRHIHESYITSYPERDKNVDYTIGLLHGSEASQKEHDQYAPFQVSELVNLGYDYWALGHIHKRQTLHEAPWIVYSGTLQGRHKKEVGQQGYYAVKLSKENTELTFRQTSVIDFQFVEFEIDATNNMDQWIISITDQLTHFADLDNSYIVECKIRLKREAWLQTSSEEELKDYVKEQLEISFSNVLISAIQFVWQNELNPAYRLLVNNVAIPVVPHPIKKYCSNRSELEWQQIVEDKVKAILLRRSDSL